MPRTSSMDDLSKYIKGTSDKIQCIMSAYLKPYELSALTSLIDGDVVVWKAFMEQYIVPIRHRIESPDYTDRTGLPAELDIDAIPIEDRKRLVRCFQFYLKLYDSVCFREC